MSKHTFVHLSDIHFGQESIGETIPHDDVKREVLRDCKQMHDLIGPADAIIVTGDIAFSGKREQFQVAGSWLDDLSINVGCEKHQVHCIPGNHDVDVTLIDLVGGMTHNHLRSQDVASIDTILGGIAKCNPDPLMAKFEHYREFASRYGCTFESSYDSRWYRYLEMGGPNKLALVGLNSVRVSDLSDTLGNLVLGNDQYILSRIDNVEYIAAMHHPVEWYRDHATAKDHLRRARVLLFGHEHSRRIMRIEELGAERLEIYAGALIGDNAVGQFTYRYNWLRFESEFSGGTSILAVTAWSRVWNPELTEFVADTTLHGSGNSTTYRLNCPEHIESDLCSVNEHENVPSPSRGEEEQPQKDTPMEGSKQRNFEKLQYYFWKYLSWQQRLTVLAEVDILPDTANQPLPQVLEQHALELAKSAGKLAELWRAVMEIVPAADRTPCPF